MGERLVRRRSHLTMLTQRNPHHSEVKCSQMSFPVTRLRRLRRTEALRSLVRETRLSTESFVYPLFVCPGEGVRKEIKSMPGVFNLSVDQAVKEAKEVHSLGIPEVGVVVDDEDVRPAAHGTIMASCSVRRARSNVKSPS